MIEAHACERQVRHKIIGVNNAIVVIEWEDLLDEVREGLVARTGRPKSVEQVGINWKLRS
jgi:hypothetical protein